MKKSSVVGLIIVIVAVIGIGIYAMSGDGSSNSSNTGSMKMDDKMSEKNSSSMMVAPNTVVMDNLDFLQKEITVKKGTTVTWKNEDTARHNVVFNDESVGLVEDSKLIGNGEELTFTFNTAGEFSYFCEPHPFMKAKIIVTE